jgi:hypothetical protein
MTGSVWAKARLEQAKPIKAQVAFVETNGLRRLYLTVWLGHASKIIETRICPGSANANRTNQSE